MQLLFAKAAAGESELPNQGVIQNFGLEPQVVADMVVYAANDPANSDKSRKMFVNEFRIKWDKTPALKYFDDFSDQHVNAIDIEFPKKLTTSPK